MLSHWPVAAAFDASLARRKWCQYHALPPHGKNEDSHRAQQRSDARCALQSKLLLCHNAARGVVTHGNGQDSQTRLPRGATLVDHPAESYERMANTHKIQLFTTVHATGVEGQASRLLELYTNLTDLIL